MDRLEYEPWIKQDAEIVYALKNLSKEKFIDVCVAFHKKYLTKALCGSSNYKCDEHQ